MFDLSIVVPVLNEAQTLPGLLASLAPLRARGAEIVIADGGSGDDSERLARAGADRVLRASCGRASQMNAGAAAAHGDVLLFLHADTRLPGDAVEAVETAIDAGYRWGYFALAIRGRHPMLPVIAHFATFRSRLTGVATGDQALFVDRALFDQAGGFPVLPLMEDVALTKRLRRMAAPAALRLQASTSGRRWESHGVIRTVALMWRLRLLYRLGVPAERLARLYADVRESAP